MQIVYRVSPGEELLQYLIDLKCEFCFATLSLPLVQPGDISVISVLNPSQHGRWFHTGSEG